MWTADHADVVVVAAGAATRVGFDKLAVPIGGRPLLAWTLARLSDSSLVDSIVVVTAAERLDWMRRAAWLPDKVANVVVGGPRRQESVAEGIGAVSELAATVPGEASERIVLVHDGARPLVSTDLIERTIRAVREYDAAIPVLPVAETVKRIRADGVVAATVDRSHLALAQTPQGARLRLFDDAYRRFPPTGSREFTDEAALLEACKIPVHAVPGEASNIKVTLPEDVAEVDRALTGRASPVGFGHDGHPFGPGEPLVLGGVKVSGAPRLHGHSDGDVVLHAIADALLGAGALGDLGRLFPADDRTHRGIASTVFLEDVLGRLAARGLRPAFVDVTILAARPRLGPRLDEIRARLAELLGFGEQLDRVSVKASTGNLDGREGEGRGISARAVAVLEAGSG